MFSRKSGIIHKPKGNEISEKLFRILTDVLRMENKKTKLFLSTKVHLGSRLVLVYTQVLY